jgi:hypothetical protein
VFCFFAAPVVYGGKLPDLHEISIAAATSLRGLPDQYIFPITKRLPV